MVQSLPGRSGTTAPGPADREGPATLVDGEEEMSPLERSPPSLDRPSGARASTMATCTTSTQDRGPVKRAPQPRRSPIMCLDYVPGWGLRLQAGRPLSSGVVLSGPLRGQGRLGGGRSFGENVSCRDGQAATA